MALHTSAVSTEQINAGVAGSTSACQPGASRAQAEFPAPGVIQTDTSSSATGSVDTVAYTSTGACDPCEEANSDSDLNGLSAQLRQMSPAEDN